MEVIAKIKNIIPPTFGYFHAINITTQTRIQGEKFGRFDKTPLIPLVPSAPENKAKTENNPAYNIDRVLAIVVVIRFYTC
jgi:hypothetical protein